MAVELQRTTPIPLWAPAEMLLYKHWIVWRRVQREGEPKPTKVPYNPATNKLASVTDPSTWGTFAQARAVCKGRHYDGLGWVFSKDLPLTGIDLDGCCDPVTRALSSLAEELIYELGSYTEYSPSGTGIHVLVHGKLPGKGRKHKDYGIEMYDSERYFTFTGDRVLDLPETIEERGDRVAAIYHRIFPVKVAPTPNVVSLPVVPTTLDDRELLDVATRAINGRKFYSLWRGDYAGYYDSAGNRDESTADLALCNLLAFYAGANNHARVDQLFRQSGLMRPKWGELRGTQTYGQITIDTAYHGRSEFYSPRVLARATTAPMLASGTVTDALASTVLTSIPMAPRGPSGMPSEANADEEPYGYHLYSDIEVQDLPPMTWLVDKLLPDQSLVAIYGEPSAGKSFLVLDLSLHIAAGLPWQGRPTNQGSVVYIAAEGRRGLQLRLMAWKFQHGIPMQHSLPIHIIGEAVPLLQPESLGKLIATLRRLETPPVLVVVDTLGRSFAGGEENSNDSMNLACNAANFIERELGCCVAFVHHKGKNAAGMRGGSALEGGVDTAIEVVKEGESDLVTMTCKKQKDGTKRFAPIFLTLREIPNIIDDLSSCVLVSAQPKDIDVDLQGKPRELLTIFAQKCNMATGATYSEWYQQSGWSRSTYDDARRALIENGWVIEPEAKGSLYQVSPKTRQWVALNRIVP